MRQSEDEQNETYRVFRTMPTRNVREIIEFSQKNREKLETLFSLFDLEIGFCFFSLFCLLCCCDAPQYRLMLRASVKILADIMVNDLFNFMVMSLEIEFSSMRFLVVFGVFFFGWISAIDFLFSIHWDNTELLAWRWSMCVAPGFTLTHIILTKD